MKIYQSTKFIVFALAIFTWSGTTFAQEHNSNEEEVIKSSDKIDPRIEAEKGTYQLIFKDAETKAKYFNTGFKTVSEHIAIGGIDSYSDLLIVIGENRLQSEEQEYVIGDNKELVIRVLSLDQIKSSTYIPLEEIVIKK